MKKSVILILLFACSYGLQAQEQTAQQLQENAKTVLQKGDFDNAIQLLQRAKKQEPDNVDVLRDLCFTYYLKRDFAAAIEVGKELVEKPNADQQSFQVLGLAYKAIASYKECGKLYRTALRKFPNSGVIYNDYAELYALDKDLDEAIVQWEKGIEVDPSYSSNYYNATMFYNRKGNWLRAALYGEIFLNLESYTTRTEEIKPQLLDAYQHLLAQGATLQLMNAKNTSPFEKSVLEILQRSAANVKGVPNMDDINGVRKKFIPDWIETKQKQYPFHLFDNQQYLVRMGMFEAYNYWLFNSSTAANYQEWQKNHAKETADYKTFQQSKVFKLPAGEYYFAQ
jgi:tetratricopeptide (TPR) repeat protein